MYGPHQCFIHFEALLHGLLLILQNIVSKLSKQIFKSFQNTTATFVSSKFLNDKWASNDLSRLTTNSTTGRFISSFTFFYYFVNYTLMPGFGVTHDWKWSGYWPPQNPAQFILQSFKYLLWLLSKLCFVRSGEATVLMPQKCYKRTHFFIGTGEYLHPETCRFILSCFFQAHNVDIKVVCEV